MLRAALGAGMATSQLNQLSGSAPQSSGGEPLKVGFVGVGARGSTVLRGLLNLDGVEIRAVCDLREDRVARAQRWAKAAGGPEPAAFTRGETDFKRMCQQSDLDLVITATPWAWHTRVCVAAMEAGKHAATEVPAAITLEECWQLVEASEKSGKHCMMLEQYCYFRQAMQVLNMVRKGLFGEVVHVEGRIQENWIQQNWHIFNSDGTLAWNGEQLSKRNGNPYPTHPMGPMALWTNVNRGDRLDYLVSMSSKSRSINISAAEHFSEDHALAKQEHRQGDANVTLLRTVNGVTMTLYYGGTSPQPWSPEHKLQGTKGTCIGDMFDYRNDRWIESKVYFPEVGTRWADLSDYLREHDHPLWKALGGTAETKRVKNWSGVYDYLMLHQLTGALREGAPPPLDVYDAATWSAISELTEKSVAKKSAAIDVPDFTKGKWKTNKPIDLSRV